MFYEMKDCGTDKNWAHLENKRVQKFSPFSK